MRSFLILLLTFLASGNLLRRSSALSTQTSTADRRSWLATMVVATTLMLKPATANAAGGDPSVFCGTFSDPINHPGGKRIISLLDDKKTGDYQLAQVQGGGGVGEPANYILPAVIFGDRSIIIDFSPKGGPRDFVGVLDGKDIKFLKDGNRWPRINTD
jgi:hypothetical protein